MLLTAGNVLRRTKKSCSQLMVFVSFSIEKIKSSALTVPPLSQLTSYTPTNFNLYPAYSLVAVVSEPDPYGFLTFQSTKSYVPFPSLQLYHSISPDPRHMYLFRNKRAVSASPQPQTGGPPLVSYLGPLIQYTRKYPHI
jgi:hypothetical protein